jgi:hypothetical protein
MGIDIDFSTSYDKTLADNWMELMNKLAESPTSSTQFSGIKYIADLVHTMPGEAFLGPTGYVLEELGYSGSGAKLAALKRIYMDEESIQIAQQKLKDREKQEFSSVVVNTIAGTKQKRSQGHCITSIIVTRNTKKRGQRDIRLSVMYRMTESVRKFGADLIFFKEVLFPAILGDDIINLKQVSFHFANISFSPLFFPILLSKLGDEGVTPFLDKLEENPTTLRAILGVIRRDMEHELGFHAYRTRNTMQTIAHKAYTENPKIKEALQEIISKKGH